MSSVVLFPAVKVSVGEAAESEMPGVPQFGNLNEAMRVLQLNDPEVCTYSVVYQNVQSSVGSMDMSL